MFRDDQPRCPFCDDRALSPPSGNETRLRCDGCKGVLVPAREVEDMILHLRREPFSLEDHLGTPEEGVRRCPRCPGRMQPVRLFGVPLDRCPAHGLWFDTRELATVLEIASGIDPDTIEDGPQYAELGWLGKLRAWLDNRHADLMVPRRPKDE